MLKLKKMLVIITFMIISFLISSCSQVKAAERISWNGRLSQGKDIFYWVESGVIYDTDIGEAVKKLRFPPGLWNPNILTRTYTKSASKMDFYQYYNSLDDTFAKTALYKPKSNGQENAVYPSELDSTEWLYGKVYLNEATMRHCDSDMKSTIILHEMCHVYGGRDVYDRTDTIMFGGPPQVRGMTRDFNDILVQKYNY